MICQMVKVSSIGEMELSIKEIFSMVKNMEKVNVNSLMVQLIKVLLEMINLMVKDDSLRDKVNILASFNKENFKEKGYSNGRMGLRTKATTKMIVNMVSENILTLRERCLKVIGEMVLEMEMV